MSTRHYCIDMLITYPLVGFQHHLKHANRHEDKFSSASYWIHNCKAIINYWRGIWLKNKINHTVHTTIFLLQSKSLKCIHTSIFVLSRTLTYHRCFVFTIHILYQNEKSFLVPAHSLSKTELASTILWSIKPLTHIVDVWNFYAYWHGSNNFQIKALKG